MGRERWKREREVAAREIQMREGGEEGRMGGCGRQGRTGPGRARPGQAGLGWVTSWIETHDTHNHRSETKRETEFATRQVEHTI